MVLHFLFSGNLFFILQLHGGTVLMFSGNSFLLCAVITDFMFPVQFYTVSIKNLVKFVTFLGNAFLSNLKMFCYICANIFVEWWIKPCNNLTSIFFFYIFVYSSFYCWKPLSFKTFS